MQSQLGMITPFFHKAPCGGNIKQALASEQSGAYSMAHTPALKYKCIGCNQFVEPEDVVETRGDYKKGEEPNMAAAGRFPAGERDKPKLPNVITGSGDSTDGAKPITNTITDAHPTGQTPGSAIPPIANTITKTGENK